MANQAFNAEIGKKIREYREGAGISQKDFAEMIGLKNRVSLSLIENGEQALSIESLTKVIQHTKLDLMSLLSLDMKKYIVVDTNIILNRPRMLETLIKDCDYVCLPKAVIKELNYRKDKGRELQKRNASLCMSTIKELRERNSDHFSINYEPSVKGDNWDDDILQVAIDLAKQHSDDMVYMFTDDKDFRLKDIGFISNLKIIDSTQYASIFVEEDGYNDALSQKFFLAVLKKNLDLAKSLIERNGKNIDVNFIDTKSGLTPLIKAVWNKDYNMVEFLLSLDRIDIDAVDEHKHRLPALSHAIQKKDYAMAEILVDHNANVNAPSQNKTNYFNTPLMIAAWEGQLEIVKLLIDNGACINQQDQKNGFTPLIKAAFKNRNEIVAYLLAKKADQTILSFESKTALDYAYKNKNRTIIEMLLEKGREEEDD